MRSHLPGHLVFSFVLMGALFFGNCRTVQDLPPYSPGSHRNPVRLNGFQGQKEYLEALRTGGQPVRFRFETTIPGYDNHWLDVYLITPPAPRSDLEEAVEERPDRMRIHLDGYHPESNAREAPVPDGYSLEFEPSATP